MKLSLTIPHSLGLAEAWRRLREHRTSTPAWAQAWVGNPTGSFDEATHTQQGTVEIRLPLMKPITVHVKEAVTGGTVEVELDGAIQLIESNMAAAIKADLLDLLK